MVFNLPLMAGTAEFPQYGFQIETLDGAVGDSPAQVVMMFLPASEGFAPSVNVQIQPYEAALKDYVALSKKQFEEMKLKIIAEQFKGDSEWVAEYGGTLQGMQLHWYARAVLHGKKIYLVTATAGEAQWAKVADKLRKNVDSFKVKP